MCSKIKDLWEDITIIPYRLYKKIQRFFVWGWFMKDSYDWDYYHLEVMMLKKLEAMRHEMTTNGHCEWCMDPNQDKHNLLKKMDLAIYLLKRLTTRDCLGYAINTHAKHDRKWGELKHSWGERSLKLWRENAYTPELEIEEREEYRKVMDIDDRIYSRDRKICYHILEKYGPGFWD